MSETLAIVQDARFAPLFAPGSLGEVPIVARLGEGDLSGQIDRLAVLDDALARARLQNESAAAFRPR